MVDSTTAGILAGYLIVFLFAIVCFVHVHKTLPPSSYSKGLKVAFGMISLEILIPFSIKIMSIFKQQDSSATDATSAEVTTIIQALFVILMISDYTVFGITQAEFFKSLSPFDEKASRRLVVSTRVFFVVDGALGFVLSMLVFTTPNNTSLYLLLFQLSIILVQIFDVVINTYMMYFLFVKMRQVMGMERQKLVFTVTWFVLMVFFVAGFGLVLGGNGQNGDMLTILGIMAHCYPLLSYLCMVCIRQVLAARQKRKQKTPGNKDGYERGLKETPNNVDQIDQVDDNANMDGASAVPSANVSGPSHPSTAQYLSSKPSKEYEPPPNTFFTPVQ